MKNKKGFTLIELLAVIVILAIIALIAVPIILNMINEARKSSAKSAALGYIDAIEYNNGFAQLEKAGYTEITGENIDVTTIDIKLKGKKPDSGTITVNNKGKVSSASDLCFNGYKVDYDGKDVTLDGRCGTSSNEQSNNTNEPSTPTSYIAYEPGDVVYFDPITTSACNSETFSVSAIKNNISTCYKWYVIDVDDATSKENIKLQLDHNIVNKSEWISEEDYNDSGNFSNKMTSKGPITIMNRLATVTSTWTRVPKLNYTYDTTLNDSNIYHYSSTGYTYVGYNYGVMTCTNGTCTATCSTNDTYCNASTIATDVRARLITGEEIRAITMNAGAAENSNADKWNLTSFSSSGNFYFSNNKYTIGTRTSGTGNTDLSWLIKNTRNNTDSGSSDNIYDSVNNGYWTLSTMSNDISRAWIVRNSGELEHGNGVQVHNNLSVGIRPVITIEKNKIEK